MTRLGSPSMIDLLKLCCNPQADEVEQYMALTGNDWVIDDVAAEMYAYQGPKFVLLDGDNPVAAGGFELLGPGVWETWMLVDNDSWEEHGVAITKHTRRLMDELFDGHAHRIQTLAMASRDKACQWYVKGLKMKQESTLEKRGANGEDFALFVKLKEQ